MRARAALLYDPAAEKATPTHDHQQSEATQAKKDEAGDESMDVEPREEQMLVPSLPEDMLLQQKAEAKPESSSVLNDAEMEDLFGPATAKTDLSMISTPANTSSQQLPTETSRIAETEKDVSLPSAPTDAAVYGPNAQPQDGANSGVEAHAPVSAVSGSQPPDPTASLFDFSSIDTNTLNSASSLPENNFDFSHMTTDDFNSLLASLGASGGGSGSTGTNLLEGLDLSKSEHRL